MLLPILAVVLGLAALVWSADRFVRGAAATAGLLGVPPLLVGMLVVGFGTSAPEMVVSAIAASEGNPGIALGNAYGSNVTNIGLILGVTALVSPIAVRSQVLRGELPVLAGVTVLAAVQLLDGTVSRGDAVVLLGVFAALLATSIVVGLRRRRDPLAADVAQELEAQDMAMRPAVIWLLVGLLGLVVSSRALVWGAVEIARSVGVSDLVIGLTVVAIGTSLPELASSVVAARRGEHELALGNIVGSNLFNTLAVVGIAGAIAPMSVGPEVLRRDVAVMGGLTLALFVVGVGFRGPGRINRWEGGGLLAAYVGYMGVVAASALGE